MSNQSSRPVGLTKSVGFQIGVRGTFSIAQHEAWRLLISEKGLKLWLGVVSELRLTKGERFRLADGSSGEVRVVSPNSHLRISWQPPGWPKASTVQLRTIPKGEKTVVAFHQENLPGAREREERREFYRSVLEKLEKFFVSSAANMSRPASWH